MNEMIGNMIALLDILTGKLREFLLYGVAGISTTVLNFLVFYFLQEKIYYVYANVIAYVAATLYAFFVIKYYVFKSNVKNLCDVLKELLQFTLARLFTGVLDTGILYLGVSCFDYERNIVKLTAIVCTITINFLASKYFIFKKR